MHVQQENNNATVADEAIRNFWQKYWQIQRCGRCSIHWQRRWSNKFYIQMSIFIVHMENLSPSNLLKSPSFSIKMMEIDWQRVTIGWSLLSTSWGFDSPWERAFFTAMIVKAHCCIFFFPVLVSTERALKRRYRAPKFINGHQCNNSILAPNGDNYSVG